MLSDAGAIYVFLMLGDAHLSFKSLTLLYARLISQAPKIEITTIDNS